MSSPGPTPARARESESLVRLTARDNLPPRVRRILQSLHDLASSLLGPVLAQTLADTEQTLFGHAERAHSSNEQHEIFEALRELKRARAEFAPRFVRHLESSLTRFDAPARTAPALPTRLGDLTLVDTHEVEEGIALQEIASKGEIRHSQALYALGHRFGVLAAAPVFDAESLPVGPQRLAEALRHAAGCFDLALSYRLQLYRRFERCLTPELGAFYTVLNDHLVEQRILCDLQVIVLRPRPNPADTPSATQESRATRNAETPAAKPAVESADLDAVPAQEPPATPPLTAPPDAAMTNAMPKLPRSLSGLPSAARTAHAEPTDRGTATAVTPAAAQDAAATARPAPQSAPATPSEDFASLRALLAARRAAPPAASASPASAYAASAEDIQAVLGLLQRRPVVQMMLGGKQVQRSFGHVRQDLLAQLRQFTPDARPPRLSEEDTDTIDLLGLLYDRLVEQTRPSGATRQLLTRLQVPLLRVALRDKTFFTHREHPARQLLDAIADTGVHWVDDGDGEHDRALIEKMQLVVDRVGHESDGKPELYEELLGDLARHMGTLARKAETAERRHVDAARGRERLDLARERAAEAVRAALAHGRPSRLVRTLIEQAWTDVLALTILRHGEDSELYRRRLEVIRHLVAGDARPGLREEIEQGLAQVGFVADEIKALTGQLLASGEPAGESPSSRTELAMRLKAKTRLGEETGTAGARQGHVHPPLDASERVQLEHLKTLPFGTWFEFEINQQGQRVRRKLSWFSTLTGRCLFVNQRGARSEDRSLEQLARDLHRGVARIAPTERESVLDRAWNGLVQALRQLTGRSPAPDAPPHGAPP